MAQIVCWEVSANNQRLIRNLEKLGSNPIGATIEYKKRVCGLARIEDGTGREPVSLEGAIPFIPTNL